MRDSTPVRPATATGGAVGDQQWTAPLDARAQSGRAVSSSSKVREASVARARAEIGGRGADAGAGADDVAEALGTPETAAWGSPTIAVAGGSERHPVRSSAPRAADRTTIGHTRAA
jgi:hypothetical protein